MHDWTYDLYLEDTKIYTALPLRGVHPRSGASDRERFMRELKLLAKETAESFNKEWDSYGYDGDLFETVLHDVYFSDWYKDVYGQRPHLPMWYYIHPLGLSHRDDTLMSWERCGRSSEAMEEYAEFARETRAYLERGLVG